MTTPAYPVVLFQGVIAQRTVRVVDRGPGSAPRLFVEYLLEPDAMGARGWGAVQIDNAMFEAILLAAGVVH